MPVIPLDEALAELKRLRSQTRARYSDAVDDEIERLAREEGLSQQAIADRLEPSYYYVAKVFRRRGLEPAGYKRRGRRHFVYERSDGTTAKIEIRGRHSAKKVIKVLSEYEDGASPSELSEKYDVPVSTIEKWTKRAGEAACNRLVEEGKPSPVYLARKAEELYCEEKLSTCQIAEILNVSTASVVEYLEKRGVELRSRGEALILRHWGSLENYKRFVRKAAWMIEVEGKTKRAVCEHFDVCWRTLTRALESKYNPYNCTTPERNNDWWVDDDPIRPSQAGLSTYRLPAR